MMTMLVGVFAVAPISAAETDLCNVGAWNTSYTLTGNGANDMIAIAEKQVGKSRSDLGYSGAWCAAFVSDCAKLAGQESVIPYHAAVSGLYANVINAGGKVVSSPQRGDLVFYKCTVDGYWTHVAIMKDSINSIHGNWNNSCVDVKYTSFYDSTNPYVQGSSNNIQCWTATFVRPNYGSNGTHDTHSYDTYVYNWDSHPHYKCYKCSCGDVKENTNEPTYVESCEYCNTHTCNLDIYYSYWEAHPHYYLYKCSLCGTVTTDYSQTKRIDSCEYCRVGKTRVYTNKDMYYPGERVILTWDEATYATHYNFYIMKKDSSGEYKERIDWITLLKQTDYYIDGLSAGEYMIELYSYDSTQWEPDGSDWCHERADLIYFTVDENAEIPHDGSITFGSNTYEIYNTTMSWTDAKAYCESQGGHLVTITSHEENEAVRELVASEGGRWCYYMGITDESSEGNWQNITGEPLSYTNWISGEPNNENGVEHYGVVRNLDAENWNDVVNVYKNNPVGFICEYEKESKLILGDADADGKVNIKDATAIQKHIANLITLTEDGYGVADVDASGSVNIKDATAIQKHIAGIDTGYFAE